MKAMRDEDVVSNPSASLILWLHCIYAAKPLLTYSPFLL
jgi:importin subunit beta-1